MLVILSPSHLLAMQSPDPHPHLQEGQSISDPHILDPWLLANLSHLPFEVFGAAFLNSHHQLIRIETLFWGGKSQTSVYPRHLVARALSLDTASLVIFHNHPSGLATPSLADQRLTHCLANLFSQIEIRLWEHLVVAGPRVVGLLRGGELT
jgi:DNA repair protein RadC